MEFSEVPWRDIVVETRDYVVFKDGYPVTDGHILFVQRTRLG